MPCPNDGCKSIQQRRNLNRHLEQDCPYELVCCPSYAKYGCAEKFHRRECQSHDEAATGQHLAMVTNRVQEQESRLELLEQNLIAAPSAKKRRASKLSTKMDYVISSSCFNKRKAKSLGNKA